jgi:hypothetical protein
MTAKSIEETYNILKKFLQKKTNDTHIISNEILRKFTTKLINYHNKLGTIKPYRIENLQFYIILAVEKIQGQVKICQKSTIKKAANRAAKCIFEKRLYRPTRAPVIPIEKVFEIIELLWTTNYNWWTRASAVLLGITFTTGARMMDGLRLYWEDIHIEETQSGKYLLLPVRVSKNNMNPKRAEQLTFRIDKNNIIQLERLISAWQIYNNNNCKGKVFENTEVVNTQKIVGYINRTLLKNKLDVKIGGHSGRNSVLLQCFEKQIDETGLKIYLRWTPNSNMHIHYRNLLLETSHVGTAYKLFKENFNQQTSNNTDHEMKLVKKKSSIKIKTEI